MLGTYANQVGASGGSGGVDALRAAVLPPGDLEDIRRGKRLDRAVMGLHRFHFVKKSHPLSAVFSPNPNCSFLSSIDNRLFNVGPHIDLERTKGSA